jgi:hypothetical protein
MSTLSTHTYAHLHNTHTMPIHTALELLLDVPQRIAPVALYLGINSEESVPYSIYYISSLFMGFLRFFAFCLSLSQSSILVKLMSIGSSSSAGRRVRRSSAQRRARSQCRVSEGRVSTDASISSSPHRRARAEQPLCGGAHAGGMRYDGDTDAAAQRAAVRTAGRRWWGDRLPGFRGLSCPSPWTFITKQPQQHPLHGRLAQSLN